MFKIIIRALAEKGLVAVAQDAMVGEDLKDGSEVRVCAGDNPITEI